jgi:hypothetical protein
MVKVYDESREIIADVDYNNNLDVWNGSNWQSGGTGKHKGLTRLEDGRFVLIYGTDWQGESNHAVIIDSDQALQEVIESGDLDLLDEFDLREKYESEMVKEKDWSTKSVKVNRKTYDRLTDLKTGNDSYKDVIVRLLDFYDEHK